MSSSQVGRAQNSGQIRLDITNFGNLLNNNWGVSQRLVNSSDSDGADGRCATGKLSYNLQNAQRQPDHVAAADVRRASSDVYVMMLSFR